MALMPMFWGRDAILEVERDTGLENQLQWALKAGKGLI